MSQLVNGWLCPRGNARLVLPSSDYRSHPPLRRTSHSGHRLFPPARHRPEPGIDSGCPAGPPGRGGMPAGKLIPIRIGGVDVHVETSRWLRAHLVPRPPASKEGEGVENRGRVLLRPGPVPHAGHHAGGLRQYPLRLDAPAPAPGPGARSSTWSAVPSPPNVLRTIGTRGSQERRFFLGVMFTSPGEVSTLPRLINWPGVPTDPPPLPEAITHQWMMEAEMGIATSCGHLIGVGATRPPTERRVEVPSACPPAEPVNDSIPRKSRAKHTATTSK